MHAGGPDRDDVDVAIAAPATECAIEQEEHLRPASVLDLPRRLTFTLRADLERTSARRLIAQRQDQSAYSWVRRTDSLLPLGAAPLVLRCSDSPAALTCCGLSGVAAVGPPRQVGQVTCRKAEFHPAYVPAGTS